MLHEIKVLEINVNLVENNFEIKEMTWKRGNKFQNKGNKCNIYKEIKLVETIGLKLNLKFEMDTFF